MDAGVPRRPAQRESSSGNPSRRGFLLGSLACAAVAFLPQPSAAASMVASKDLFNALADYPWTRDAGSGHRRVMYILFEPTCPYSRVLYARNRSLVDLCEFRWVPFANRTRISQGATIRLTRTRAPDDLKVIMSGGASRFISYASEWPQIATKDPAIATMVNQILPMVRVYSGGPVGSPTSVFETEQGAIRLIRGAWDEESFRSFFWS